MHAKSRRIAAATTCALAAQLAWSAQPDEDLPTEAHESEASEAIEELTGRPPLVTFSVSARGDHRFKADLKEGEGDMSVTRVRGDLGVGFTLDQRTRLGLAFGHEQSRYRFGDFDLLSGVDRPLRDAHTTDFGARLSRQFDENWGAIIGARVEFSGESGADLDDSATYGGLGIITYRFSETLTVGAGAAVSTRLEDSTLVIPIVLVDVQISDRLSFGNIDPRATAGLGVGAALRYKLTDEWTLSLGAGYQRREYRLDNANTISGGVFRDAGFPIVLDATYAPNPHFSIGARAGAMVWHRIELFDDGGRSLTRSEIEPTPFVGFGASVRF